MAIDRRKATVFGSAAVLRALLFFAFPSLPDLLTGRVEISTPITSFKRRKLPSRLSCSVTNGKSSTRRSLPLYSQCLSLRWRRLLPSASLAPTFRTHPSLLSSLVTSLLYILLDLLCAHFLIQIAESNESRQTRLFQSPRRELKWDGVTVAAAFLFNPFTIASCLGRPTSIFTSCAILSAISLACTSRPLTAMLALGLASYLSMYPALLLPPLILLSYDHLHRENRPIGSLPSFAIYHTTAFATSITTFLSESYLLMGSWEFISSTYGTHLLLPDLTPNVGLWWYFFIEMFDSFREFFLGVFWIHLGGYVGGLCFRLRKQPLFVITLLLGLCAIFKPYPSISDTSLFCSLLPCYRHVFPCLFPPRDWIVESS